MDEDDNKVAKRIQAKRKKLENHKRKADERSADTATIKAAYISGKDSVILKDILAKARAFSGYHLKIAADGVGARKTGHIREDRQPEVENYFLKPSERVTHLDKSSGIQEILNYIERQLTELPPQETEEKSEEDTSPQE